MSRRAASLGSGGRRPQPGVGIGACAILIWALAVVAGCAAADDTRPVPRGGTLGADGGPPSDDAGRPRIAAMDARASGTGGLSGATGPAGRGGAGKGGAPTNPGEGGAPTNPGEGGAPANPGTGGANPGEGGAPASPGTGGTPANPGTGGAPASPGTGGSGPESAPAAAMKRERRALIQFLWGDDGFPTRQLPSSIEKNVPSPVAGLSNLERVDTLHLTMDAGVESLAHHFIPAAAKRNRLVILHHGHAQTFDDDPGLDDAGYGMQRTIDNLLVDGYSVLAVYMPGCLLGKPEIAHASIVEMPTTGSGVKFFLEPVATYLNYLQTQAQADAFPAYTDFSMVGLSGGGWTTTIYAALDPRITLSIPVAGTLPLALRWGSSVGDEEQFYPPFYALADYPDLYVLGAVEAGRRQVQVLNRHDDCCFGEAWYEYNPAATGLAYDDAVRGYELDVRRRLDELGGGAFRLEIDEAAPGHMISWNTIGTIILAELDANTGGAAVGPTGDTFARGPGGTLLRLGATGATDTTFPMVGTPAVVARDGTTTDVFFRDPTNRLMHAWNAGATWSVESFDTVVITDPVAIETAPPLFDVVAPGMDSLPRHFRGGGDTTLAIEAITGAPAPFGRPALDRDQATNLLHVSAKGRDGTSYDLFDDGSGTWLAQPAAQP